MEIKNKKVLVTGADGFIGSHLVEELLNEGCRVKAMVLYNSFNSWGWLDSFDASIQEKIEIISGDIRDSDFIRKSTKDINVVFHLAALIAIPFSYSAPQSYIDTNVKGTLNILEASRLNNVERVIVTSTSEVYGTARYVPINESHPLQPQSPYSASKIGADAIATSFYNSFNMPVIIARPFNTYGPRQSARAIIPTIITQLLGSKDSIKLGSLTPVRDFTYIKDTCTGFVSLARTDDAIGKTIHFGSGQETSIGELSKLLIKLINPSAQIVMENLRKRPENSEVEKLLCDYSLMKKITGWEPRITLIDGLKKTIEWFREKQNLNKYKPDIYNQ